MTNLLKWWQTRGDRRGALRYPARRSAVIDLNNGLGHRACMIRDISDSGARLLVPVCSELPEEFTLLVPHRCRVVRRENDGQVGVRFVDDDRTVLLAG
jgi:hypothetical protein